MVMELKIEIKDRKLFNYIRFLITASCRNYGMTLIVEDGGNELVIKGEDDFVIEMKKIIENHFKALNEFKDKIGEFLTSVEKSEIKEAE